MAHSSLKLCWMHPESNGKIATKQECCTKSSEAVKDNDGNIIKLPKCQEGCVYYSRCKRVFEMGNFNNNCWDAPNPFRVNSADITVMRSTQMIRTGVNEFVESGSNMVIYSCYTGNGKTSRATSLANTYISNMCKLSDYNYDRLAHYAYIPKLVSDHAMYDKASYDNVRRQIFFDYLDNLNYSDLVIWDGLGFNSNSVCENVIIRSIINTRINSKLSNIFVINRSLEEFSNILDNYDYTRMINASVIFEFKGNDFRKQNSESFQGGMQ